MAGAIAGYSQFDPIVQQIELRDSIADFQGREKIFIHRDKPYYQVNDTLWLKGYIVSGLMNRVNDSSRIAYLEFIDSDGTLVKRISAACEFGLFYANITLGEQLFPQGNYILRAYTQRMRNFGDSLFFQTDLKIIDPRAELWKATIKEFNFTGNKLFIAAGIKSAANEPLANSRVTVALKLKNKTLFRKRMITDAGGNIFIDTSVKRDADGRPLHLDISGKAVDLKIPLPDSKSNIDVQFLPEGGRLIAGFKQKVGVKAINQYGKGISVAGVIKDSKNNTIVPFASEYNGMGLVEWTPLRGESYVAHLSDGSVYPIPAVVASGWALRVDQSEKTDSIIIHVNTTDPADTIGVFITGTTRGYSFLKGRLRNRQHYELKLATTVFPSGVARITLYNAKGVAVNERALFIWHNDDLKLELSSNKATYINKDSVGLLLKATNESGEPVPASFSIAVIDTSQVTIDRDAENIVSYMALSADLKGNVETPGYFIKNPHSRATDALMLTQGWVSYNFEDWPRQYGYEKEFGISGNVTNVLNKPSPNTRVTLFGRDGSKGIFFKDTLTDQHGHFYFRDFPLFLTDSVSTVIQAVNKREKSFGIGVEVMNKEYPVIPEPETQFDIKSFLFDTTAKSAIDRRSAVMEQLKRDGRYLEEVIVTAKARIPGSKNLNDDGGSDQTITQSVLEKTPKENLLTLLGKQVPGFPVVRGAPFAIGRSRVEIVIDGMDLKFFEMNPIDILQYYMAEDVKGIEVMKSARYSIPYQVRFNEGRVDVMDPPTYIEITTHGGVGPFLKKLPGIYLLKPDAPFLGREFYSPKYKTPDEETVFPDLRQTVYWNPYVITNNKGEASLSFYTSESKGSYLIIVQGTDLQGGFGSLTGHLKISGY